MTATILVIDDEQVILELVSEVMEEYRVLTAASGAEARAILERGEHFDVAVVDKNLPDISGLDLVRWLRVNRPESEALIMTGYPSLDSAVEAIAAGATDYLIKPMRDINEMRLRVNHAVERVQRSRAERSLAQALRESEERYRELFEASPDAVIVLDAETRIVVDANVAAQRLYGCERTQLVGMSATQLTAESPVPIVQGDGLILRHERRADAKTVAVEVTTTFARSSGRSVLVEVVRDVSERERLAADRRELEQRLVRAGRLEAMGKLAAGIAHDFNNLLCIVSVGNDIVGQTLDTEPEVAREELEQIAHAVESATALTRQLLAFSGRKLTRSHVVDVGVQAEQTGKLLRRTIGSRIRLNFELAPEPLTIEIDPSHLEQVITNLAINARDAMPSGGAITVATRRDQGGVVLSVTDTGTGIPPHVLEDIFDPFFTTKSPDKGTGLGLATVREIVKGAGGRIDVASTMGTGTTFAIWFPESSGTVQDVTGRVLIGIPAGRGESVLLVEDEAHLREITRRVLVRGGYAVQAVADAEAALALVESGVAPAVLVTDIELPGMSGIDCARKLRERDPALRVLYISGMTADPRDRTATGVRFLAKPYSPEALMRSVRGIVDGAT
jgi:PAS domain S-box-containing protein